MSEAYQCERCKDFQTGGGIQIRYGTYEGTSGFSSQYDFEHTVELCDSCKTELDELVSGFLKVKE